MFQMPNFESKVRSQYRFGVWDVLQVKHSVLRVYAVSDDLLRPPTHPEVVVLAPPQIQLFRSQYRCVCVGKGGGRAVARPTGVGG